MSGGHRMNFFDDLYNDKKDLEIAKIIAKKADEIGGCAYFVGGYVRDKLLGIADNNEKMDIDIEVHGVIPKKLEEIIDAVGVRLNIGESFGIYSIKGSNIDIALPRKEKLRGKGHRDFDVIADPFIGTKKAAERRDFTVNALMENILTGEIIDHFGGRDDLKNKILRHVNDDTFCEDPLRVLRLSQFSARFLFEVSESTIKLCKSIRLDALSKERIFGELEKALLKAEKPSIFFEVLRKTNQLSYWFCELEELIGVEQNKKYHAEGDVWNHTMMVIDEAAKLREKVLYPLGFMLSAVVHDFGKSITTKEINGVIHAYNHENAGLKLVDSFIKRLTSEGKIKKYVLNMTALHMKPNILAKANSGIKATNKMFDEAISPKDLIYFSVADSLGRIKENSKDSGDNKNADFLFERLKVYEEMLKRPYVTGKDLLDAGLESGKYFSEALSYAHKLRLAGIEKEEALKQVLGYVRKLKRGD